MDKTEKKTAEELASRLRCTNGLMCDHHTEHAKILFERYAAQELADYKVRLKEAFPSIPELKKLIDEL